MWQQHPVIACAISVALLVAAAAWGDVGLTRVTPDQLTKVSDRLHVAVGVAPREPNVREMFISGPTADGIVVSATLVLVGDKGEERLRVPVRVDERPRRAQGPEEPTGATSTKEWYLSCRLDRDLAARATIDVLLDQPARNVGGVYRIAVGDFLQPGDEVRTPSEDGG